MAGPADPPVAGVLRGGGGVVAGCGVVPGFGGSERAVGAGWVLVNTTEPYRDRVDPEAWEDPVMRLALAARDITAVYRLLQKLGFSQQRIAALTGQSQPEVSAIIHGRKVLSYNVLSRICAGLGVPRGYMGLAWCTCQHSGPNPSEQHGQPAP